MSSHESENSDSINPNFHQKDPYAYKEKRKPVKTPPAMMSPEKKSELGEIFEDKFADKQIKSFLGKQFAEANNKSTEQKNWSAQKPNDREDETLLQNPVDFMMQQNNQFTQNVFQIDATTDQNKTPNFGNSSNIQQQEQPKTEEKKIKDYTDKLQ